MAFNEGQDIVVAIERLEKEVVQGSIVTIAISATKHIGLVKFMSQGDRRSAFQMFAIKCSEWH